MLHEQQHLGDREHADDGDEEADAFEQVDVAEGEALHAGRRVDADHGDAEAERGRDGRLALIGARNAAERGEGEGEQGEIFSRAEQQRDLNQQRGNSATPMVATKLPTKEAMPDSASASPALPFSAIG